MISPAWTRGKQTYGSSGKGNLCAAPIGARRDYAIGDEKARKARLAGKTKIQADRSDRLAGLRKPVDRPLHPQRIQVNVRGDADLLAEQLVEVRPGETGLARHPVELDGLAQPLLQE